jgi:hypothetical protein
VKPASHWHVDGLVHTPLPLQSRTAGHVAVMVQFAPLQPALHWQLAGAMHTPFPTPPQPSRMEQSGVEQRRPVQPE